MPRDVYNELRSQFLKEYRAKNQALFQTVGSVAFYTEARKLFAAKCTPVEKIKYLKAIIEKPCQTDEDALLKSNAEGCLAVLQVKTGKLASNQVKSSVVILVYNSDKFVYMKYKCKIEECLEDHVLIQTLVSDAEVMRLCEYFFAFVARKAEEHHWDWSASVEVSPDTYRTKGVLRLHLSCALGCLKVPIRFSNPWSLMAFDGVPPTYSPSLTTHSQAAAMRRKGYAKCFGEACYYLTMPKILKVASKSSKEPFKDFAVCQTTITSYVQEPALINRIFAFVVPLRTRASNFCRTLVPQVISFY